MPAPVTRRSLVQLPEEQRSPLRTIAVRVLIAVGLVVFVALLTYIGRDGSSTRPTTRSAS
jgi:hypothetical protein